MAGPLTGRFQTPVWTVLPCHGTSFGIPTLTDNSVGCPCCQARPMAFSSFFRPR